jgi:predicted DCC family thiol-disulfide oxidoreductase YuxK
VREGAEISEGEREIIVFDAECVLCSANARFVIKRDKAGIFRFAAMQSSIGRAILLRAGLDPDRPMSLVVQGPERSVQDSDAVLYIYSRLGSGWRPLSAVLRAVPAGVRDPVYRSIARNRYRWFGRRATCWVPTPAERERLL